MTDPGPTFDLTDAGDRMPIRPGDVDAVVTRARRRTARRRQTLGVLTAVALVAAVPVAQRLTSSDDGTPVATEGGARRGALGLTWRRVQPTTSVGMARGLATDGPIYALSSAPGERFVDNRQPSRVVWRSDDGVEWRAASTLGDDLFLADLTTADKRVYAVGTAPGEAASTAGRTTTLRASDLVVGWSDDEAKTWQKKKLPLDLPAELPTRFGSVAGVEVASGPKGTVAVAVLVADLDVPRLVPAGVAMPYGWSTTDTGVDILGPLQGEPCPEGYDRPEKPVPGYDGEAQPIWCQKGDEVVTKLPQEAHSVTASYTWEQLGVDGDLLAAVLRRPIAFFAEPGSTDFQRVELPEANRAGGVAVEAGEEGFTLVAATGDRGGRSVGEVVVFQSSDGRGWAKASLPQPRGWSTALGEVDGRAAFVASDNEGTAITMADGNGGWRSTSLAEVVDADVLGERTVNAGTAAFGPFGVAVHVVLVDNRSRSERPDIDHRILVSRDGITWDDLPVDDVVGEAGAVVNRLTVTGEEIVVTASLPVDGKPDGPRRQVVVVGSPG